MDRTICILSLCLTPNKGFPGYGNIQHAMTVLILNGSIHVVPHLAGLFILV